MKHEQQQIVSRGVTSTLTIKMKHDQQQPVSRGMT